MDLTDTLGNQEWLKDNEEIIKEAVPGGGLLMGVVNELLPKTKQLDPSASGDDIAAAIDSLPAADKARVLEKEFDVEMTFIKESGESNRAMLEAELKSTHTTRPWVIKGCFLLVAGISMDVVIMWSWAILNSKTGLVIAITNGWPMILAILGPFFVILRSYFGILQKESKNKLDAANGNPTGSMASSLISGFLNR